MAEVRYNNQSGQLASVGTDVTNSPSATVINFENAPDWATLSGGDTITVVLDAYLGSTTFEIVHVAAYTAGDSHATVTRQAEDAAHWPACNHPVTTGPPATGTWACAPTVADFTSGGGAPTGPAGGDLTGTYPNPTLVPVITPKTQGGPSVSVTVGVDNNGRILSLTQDPILINENQVSNLVTDLAGKAPATSGTSVLKGDGSGGTAAATAANIPTVAAGGTGPLNATDASVTNSRAPNGSASGDLSGSYPGPTVAKINGTAMSSLATGLLKNTTGTGVPSIAAAADVPTVAAGATGPLSATDASTTNSRAPSGAAGGDLAGTYPSPTLKATGPGATGPIGNSASVPVVTIDAQGRVTALTSTTTVGSVAATDSSIVMGGTAGAPTVQRAALTGDATASAGSNATTVVAVQGVAVSAIQAARINPATALYLNSTFG